MKNNAVLVSIFALLLLAVVGIFWQASKTSSDALPPAAKEALTAAKNGKAPLPATRLPSSASAGVGGTDEAASRGLLQSLKKASPQEQSQMLKDPKYLAAIKHNIISKHDSIYGEYYQKLPMEKVTALQQLQADQVMWLANNARADGSPPSIDEFTKAQYEYDLKMKELLGPQEYGDLLQYRKTVPDRMMVSSFASRAAQAGLQVTPQEIKTVENLVISKRSTLFEGVTGETVPLPAPPDPSTVVSKNYTEAEKQQILETHASFNEKMAATNQDVLQSAASVLDPAKLTILSDVMSGTAGYEPYVKAGSTNDAGAVKVK